MLIIYEELSPSAEQAQPLYHRTILQTRAKPAGAIGWKSPRCYYTLISTLTPLANSSFINASTVFAFEE